MIRGGGATAGSVFAKLNTMLTQMASGGGGNSGNVLDGIVRWEDNPTFSLGVDYDIIVFSNIYELDTNNYYIRPFIDGNNIDIFINGKAYIGFSKLIIAALPTGVRMTLRIERNSSGGNRPNAELFGGLVGFYN